MSLRLSLPLRPRRSLLALLVLPPGLLAGAQLAAPAALAAPPAAGAARPQLAAPPAAGAQLAAPAALAAPPAAAARRAQLVRAKWAGFGGTLGAWAAQRHRDVAGCDDDPCFGVKVPGPQTAFQYNGVTSTAGFVSGWWQALPVHSSTAQAEVSVLASFPADTQIGQLTVLHRDLFGASCAFLNVQSATLASWYGKKSAIAPDGAVAIELFSLAPGGYPVWNDADVIRAIVLPTAYSPGDNC